MPKSTPQAPATAPLDISEKFTAAAVALEALATELERMPDDPTKPNTPTMCAQSKTIVALREAIESYTARYATAWRAGRMTVTNR